MSYPVDTNVVAELARREPDRRVLSWFREVSDADLHLCVLMLGELRKGVESLVDVRRSEGLRVWLENDLAEWFGDRLLPISAKVADRWGRLLGQAVVPPVAIAWESG